MTPPPAALRVSFPASVEQVEQFIAGIHDFLADQNLSVVSFDMELLAREALVNAVQHGCASDPTRKVHAALTLERGELLLTVRDEGPGWDWRTMPTAPPDPRSESGRGIFIIRKYSDYFTYNDIGNTLTICKRVPSEVPAMDNDDSSVRLTLEARVTAHEVPALREVLRARIQEGARDIRLDFTQVQSLDSMGIGLLVATHNSLLKIGGKLVLSGVNKEIQQLLTLMRLDKHISITPCPGI